MEPADLTHEPVSPELALVDPELAARARAALPWRPWPPVPRIAVEPPAPIPVGRRRSFFAGYVAFGVAAAAAVTVLSVVPTPDRPTLAASPESVQQQAPVTRPRVATVKKKVATRRVRRPSPRRAAAPTRRPKASARPRAKSGARPRPTARKRPVATPKRTATTQATVKAPARPRPQRRPPVTVELRPGASFAWPPIKGARAYEVLFLRNARTFYKGQTRTPRIRLPRRLRITPAQYRWVVWPLSASAGGLRREAPIVDSTFRIARD